eukprot:c18416_g1_i1.p1 GENE.c18416_g1_i1~~c18416_g1_i1.p1  ORF type:complete len:1024 (-),score=193.99 c18416_g1_i1:48-3119(-)
MWGILLSVVGSAAGAQVSIGGVGASFPSPLYRAAAFAFQMEDLGYVDYFTTNSEDAICAITQINSQFCKAFPSFGQTFDFVTSDIILSEDDYKAVPDLQMYPTVVGGVVPIINIPGLNKPLNLTMNALASIFRGAITSWDHPDILNPNPAAPSSLMHHPIVVYVREDFSGTTQFLREGLAHVDPEFEQQIGTSPDPSKWPATFTRIVGGNVGAMVAATNFSISYIVYEIADELRSQELLSIVDVVKDIGILKASQQSIRAATCDMSRIFWRGGSPPPRLIVTLPTTDGTHAWPFTGVTYLIMRTNTTFPGHLCSQRNLTISFWEYFLSSSVTQRLAEDLGYAVLPGDIREFVLERLIADTRCNDRAFLRRLPPAISLYGPMEFRGFFSQFATVFQTNLNFTFVSKSHLALKTEAQRVAAEGNPRNFSTTFSIVPYAGRNVERSNQNIAVIPYAVLPIVVVSHFPHHLCNLGNATLVLDSDVVGRVFGGQPVQWNDKQIQALNPALVNCRLTGTIVARLPDNVAVDRALRSFVPQPEFQPRVPRVVNNAAALSFVVANPLSLTVIPQPVVMRLSQQVNIAALISPNSFDAIEPGVDSALACASDTFDSKRGAFDLNKSKSEDCYPMTLGYDLVVRLQYDSDPISISNEDGDAVSCYAPAALANFLRFLHSTQTGTGSDGLLPFTNLPQARGFSRREIDRMTCDGRCINCKTSYVQVPAGVVNFVNAVATILVTIVALLGGWVYAFRNKGVIGQSQPVFLGMTLVGCLLSSAALYFLVIQPDFDDSGRMLPNHVVADAACALVLWLYSIGFVLTFVPLFAKMWRIRRIFHGASSPVFVKVQITARAVLPIVLVPLGVMCAVLTFFQFHSPLYTRQTILKTDPFDDRVLDSYTTCTSKHPSRLYLSLMVITISALVVGNWLCYSCRNIPTVLEEGKWISFCLFSWLETMVLGVPVMLLFVAQPHIQIVLKALLVFVQCSSVFVFVFGPRLYLVWDKVSTRFSTGLLEDSHNDAPSPSTRPNLAIFR